MLKYEHSDKSQFWIISQKFKEGSCRKTDQVKMIIGSKCVVQFYRKIRQLNEEYCF